MEITVFKNFIKTCNREFSFRWVCVACGLTRRLESLQLDSYWHTLLRSILKIFSLRHVNIHSPKYCYIFCFFFKKFSFISSFISPTKGITRQEVSLAVLYKSRETLRITNGFLDKCLGIPGNDRFTRARNSEVNLRCRVICFIVWFRRAKSFCPTKKPTSEMSQMN